MAEKGEVLFDWRRRWRSVPRVEHVRSERSSANSQDEPLRCYVDIEYFGCLILLGPPGLGKSTELSRAAKIASDRGETTSFVLLKNIATSDDLGRELSQVFEVWRDSDKECSVFLDGLDEAPARSAEIRAWIIGWLQKLKIDSFRRTLPKFRLTCRSANWPERFAEDLAAVWGSDAVGVFELAPLSDEDVDLAIEPWTSEQRRYFSNVLSKGGLQPFAYAPITLRMLRRLFEATTALPTSLVDLYRGFLLAAVEERRADEVRGVGIGAPTPQESLLLLGRLAAVCLLSNKVALWTGLYSEAVPNDALSVTEVAGGVEYYETTAVNVDERALRQVVQTSVLHLESPNRFAWVHRSLVEFLAAYYLAANAQSAATLLTLLATTEGPTERVAPQLQEVAAWLAGMRSDFRALLLDREPVLLLRSDVASADIEFKARLLGEIFLRFEREESREFVLDPRADYSRLQFPGIAKQLSAIIGDKTKRLTTRRLAMNIARACDAADVEGELFAVALNTNENSHLRASAIVTIDLIGDRSSLNRLKPSLNLSSDLDPDDEVKGACLDALWPSHISEEELFGALTPPRATNLIGLYRRFLYALEFQTLSIGGAVAGLNWIRNFTPNLHLDLDLGRLVNKVLSAAWQSVDSSDVREAFVDLIFTSYRDPNSGFAGIDTSEFLAVYSRGNPEYHRLLLGAVFRKFRDAGLKAQGMLFGPLRLVTFGDLSWLLDELIKVESDFPEDVTIDLIVSLIAHRPFEEIEHIWDYAKRSERLDAALVRLFSIDLDSSVAAWMREDFRRATEKTTRAPLRREQVQKLIGQCAENIDAWWRLNFALALDEDGTAGDELTGDLTETPGWREATLEERELIVSFAFQYLVTKSPLGNEWIGANTIDRPAAAGYRALRLLWGQNRVQFDALPTEVWENWVGSILWFPNNDSSNERAVQAELAATARKRAPTQFLVILQRLLQQSTANYETAELVRGSYDGEIEAAIWNAIKHGSLDVFSQTRLVELLIEHEFKPALDWVSSFLGGPPIEGLGALTNDAVEIFGPGLWFLRKPSQAWPMLWARRLIDPPHARAIWIWVANRNFGSIAYPAEFSPELLADLYVWLANTFPSSSEPISGWVGPEHQLGMARNAILNHLVTSGTSEAVAALQRLRIELPQEEGLAWQLSAAKERLREATWKWLNPKEVLARLGIRTSMDDPNPVITSVIAKATAESSQSGRSIEDASLGLSATVVIQPAERPAESVQKATKAHTIMLVATEWSSGHGGVSSLNRDLSAALARHGHKVFCLLPSATDSEKADAARRGVEIIETPTQVGFEGEELLAVIAQAPIASSPEIIIGHDHVTGRAAFRIKQRFYPTSRYLHCLHTIPSESELYKEQLDGQHGAVSGYTKERRQKELCLRADLVIGIGPKICDHVRTKIPEGDSKVFILKPGLNPDLLMTEHSDPEAREMKILWFGRAEDPDLKGLLSVIEIANLIQNEKPDGIRLPKISVRGLDPKSFAQQIEQLSAGKSINKNAFEWLPYSSDAQEIADDIRGASCVIMPSASEPFGLVALEAIAAGIPVIVSSSSGIGQLLLTFGPGQQGALQMASDTVMDVRDNPTETAQKWAPVVLERLQNRKASFLAAKLLRERLGSLISWDISLAALQVRIDAIM